MDAGEKPMKILSVDPKAIAAPGQLDDSRLGNHVRGIGVEALEKVPTGIVLIGFADETGIRNVGGRVGAAAGPGAVRTKLYKFTTGAPSLPLYDLGDLQPAASIEETHVQGASLVQKALAAGHVPVVIGGGHDLGFPHAIGALRARPKRTAFINIDAHLDVRPTTSGITSGSPWYLLAENELFQKTRSRVEEFGLQEHCNAHVLVRYAEEKGFGLHWLPRLRAKGKDASTAFAALLKQSSKNDGILISLDIDSVNWSEAPGCSAPQTVGFTGAEVIRMAELSGATPRVRSFGLFELSPPLDRDGQTATLAAHCINGFLRGRGAWKRVKK
jgi:formiminoglutamase